VSGLATTKITTAFQRRLLCFPAHTHAHSVERHPLLFKLPLFPAGERDASSGMWFCASSPFSCSLQEKEKGASTFLLLLFFVTVFFLFCCSPSYVIRVFILIVCFAGEKSPLEFRAPSRQTVIPVSTRESERRPADKTEQQRNLHWREPLEDRNF